ncbi:MAG TPA: GNAT family N-acetyltransferase [Vicinamibacterales bacterium]|nr:GNAT family N-acetyltransferase [Vicinamibacterales bacterium]
MDPAVRVNVRIRPALAADREFVLGLAPRLVEFDDVPGRDREQMVSRDRAVLARVLDVPAADSALFVAEDQSGRPVGFIHLTTAEDYYSDSTTAHVADVVVVPEASSRGVGAALIAHAETWAVDRGFALLTLNVFVGNRRAREFYERLGFEEEWLRCIKRVRPQAETSG